FKRGHRIDYLGAALLSVALTALILFTTLGGTTLDWLSPPSLGLLSLGLIATVAFGVVEARASQPILPLRLFLDRTFNVAISFSFIVVFSLFGSVTYLPIYLQVVKGVSPTQSGLQLMPMMLGTLITSVVGGRIISTWGHYRVFPIIGTALMTVGL